MAEKIEGFSIELDLDSLKVNSGLKDLKSSLRTVNSEMKANMSAFDRSDRSIEKYETRLNGLNKKLEVQSAVTEKAYKHYEKMTKEHGEGSVEAEKAARAYNNEVASLNNLERYIGKTTNELKEFEKQQRIANSSWTKLGNKLESASNSLKTISEKTGVVGRSLTNNITKPALIAGGAVSTLVGALGWKRLTGLDAAKAQLNGLGYEAEDVERITRQVTTAIDGGMTTMAEGTAVAAGALAAGVKEGKKLEKYIKLVGDAAAGAKRPVADMARIFNRVQGSGKLMTQELNMIEQSMPGFAQAMADSLANGSLESFRKMVTNGKVGSKDFLKVMDSFAGNMASAYSKSWDGMVKNTLAYVGIIGENLLRGVFQKSKEEIADFIEILKSDAVVEWAEKSGKAIGENFRDAIDWIRGLKDQYDALSPKQQDLLKKIALIGPAVAVGAGPALTIFSKLTMGISGTLSVASKLSKGLGVANGTGLVASLGSLGQLAIGGIAVAGLTAVGIAAYKLHKRSKEATEVNLDLAESFDTQANDLQILVEEYDKLSEKSKLTTDEFGRLMDIQKELNQTSNPALIAELKDEYSRLAEKSGLSKDEINKLIDANNNLIEQSPNVEKSFTDKGNAVVESTDAVKEYIKSLRDMAIEELQIEQAMAFEKRKELLEGNKELTKEIADIEGHMNDLVAARNIPLDEVDARLAEIQNKQNSGLLTAEEHNELSKERSVLEQVSAGLVAESLETAQKTKKELQEKLNLNDEELAKLELVNEQLASAHLKEVDINYEKGEGLNKLDETIEKLKEERKELENNTAPAQKKTDEYRKQKQELEQSIEKHESIRKQIKTETGYQSEQNKKIDDQNRKLDKSSFHIEQSIVKTQNQGTQIDNNNKKTDAGIEKEKERTKEAGKSVDKKITAKDHGTIKEINDEASKPVNKIINFVGRGLEKLKFWEKGTPPSGHPGGPAIIGERGSELVKLPSGQSFLSPSSHTLLDLPRGSHVIPHQKTRSIIRNAPRYANGTNDWVGALNNSEFARLLAINDTNPDIVTSKSKDDGLIKQLLSAALEQNQILMKILDKDSDLYLDSRSMAKMLYDPIDKIRNRKEIRVNRGKGI